MSENAHVDYIRKIVDEDQELIALVTQSEQNVLLFKLQINIQGSFTPEFKFNTFHSVKLNYPTPCQYAVIANKCHSLKGIINFLCNQKDDYKCFALPKYEHGLKLDIKSVFCPTVSNTTWPLIHLAVGLGHKECLNVLIDFLKDQNKLSEFLNSPDDHQRTPLSIAFATGDDDIIDLLLKNGADPYFDKDVVMPFIYTCIHCTTDQVIKAIKNIEYHTKENPFVHIENKYFDEVGFAHDKNDEGTQELYSFLSKVPDVADLFAQRKDGRQVINTLDKEDSKGQSTQSTNSTSSTKKVRKCEAPNCEEIQNLELCHDCNGQHFYCDKHIENHDHI